MGDSGVVGVGLVVLRGPLTVDLVGVLAGVTAAGSMVGRIVLTKRWGRPADAGAATIAGWQLTAGGLLLVPLALTFEGLPSELDLPAVGGYAWLAVVGASIAYPVWFRGIAHLPVVAVSFLALLSPVVATVLGWLFLGQILNALQSAGFALALTAVAAAQLPPSALRQLAGAQLSTTRVV